MKKVLIFSLAALLLLCAYAMNPGQNARLTDQPDEKENSLVEPVNMVSMSFPGTEELGDFIAATDDETREEWADYPRETQDTLSTCLSLLRERGYYLVLCRNGKTLLADSVSVTADTRMSSYGANYWIGDGVQIGSAVIPLTPARGKTADICVFLSDFEPSMPLPDTFVQGEARNGCMTLECAEVEWDWGKTHCSGVMTSNQITPDNGEKAWYCTELRFLYDDALIVFQLWEKTFDMELLSQLTLEKVPLPDAEEARARVEQREKAAKEAEEAYKTAQAEALLGPPKAESFPLSREELLAFLNTVDAAAYPAVGDRGEGKLRPLITQIREEAYVWLPSVDGVPAEPKAGYYTVKSLGTHSLPEYSVEGFLAGDPARVYNLYVTYPGEEARVLLEKSVEAFRQGQSGQTVTAGNWKEKEYIADYREAEFMLNGEKLTGVTMAGVLSTDPDHWRTHLWFYYDGKLMELNTYEAPEPSFDLSMFEGLTLEKTPLN